MKIAFISLDAIGLLVPGSPEPFGGAEVQTVGLARELAARGHEVSVIVCGDGPDQAIGANLSILRSYPRDAGLPFLRFFHPRLSGLWRAMARADADVYVRRTAGQDLAAVAAWCRLHGRASLFSSSSERGARTGSLPYPASVKVRILFDWAIRHVDGIVAQTREQGNHFSAYGPPVYVIPNWCAEPVNHASALRDSFLWVGTMKSLKRPDLFVDLASAVPEAKFLIIGPESTDPGDASLLFELHQRAQRLGNLQLLGFRPRDELLQIYAHAIALVNTSVYEGFPNTFLEAWTAGASVLSLHADPDDLIVSLRAGYRANGLPDLMEAVRLRNARPAIARSEGERGCAHATAHFRMDGIATRWEHVLRELPRVSHRKEAG